MEEKNTNKLEKSIAKIIENQLGFTNGWRISDEEYTFECKRATERIIKALKRRKIL